MPRKCSVCSSTHVVEYEKMYLEDKRDVEYVWRYSKEKYGEEIGYSSFLRHFRNDVDKQIEYRRAIEKEKGEVYKKVIKGTMQVGESLLKNLELCNTKIQNIIAQDDPTAADETILLKYMSETRMTIEQIFKWRDQMNVNDVEDERPMIEQIMDTMKKTIPVEHLITFNEEWSKTVREKQIKL
jgi:hypothetical protein